jgi:signal transduction histidine kinase
MSKYHKYRDPKKPPAIDDVAKLQMAMNQQEQKLDAVVRIANFMGEDTTFDEKLHILVTHGQLLIPFEILELMLIDESGEHMILYSICYEGKIKWGIRANFKGTELENIVKERRISLIGDIEEEKDFPVTDVVHVYNIRSIIQIPIATIHQLWGFINLYQRAPKSFTQNHLEIAQFFCTTLSFTFENALFKEKLDYFKSATKVASEPDYALSLFLREELRKVQDKIVEKCLSFNQKGMGKLTIKQQDVVKEIQDQAELGQRRIDQLDEYLLLSGGQVYLERRKVDLARSIPDAIEKLRFKIEDRGFRVFQEIDKKLPLVIVDYKRLQRILIALIENALEASKPGSNIRISAYEEKDEAIVEVTDFGEEINKLDFENIFRPFGKIEHTMTAKRGKLIINLPIIKSLVELSDGRIWVQSHKEEGTTFFFTLPIIRT